MTNLYYFNKFTDKLELVAENIKDVNENYNNLIIDFYYDTMMYIFDGDIIHIEIEDDTSGWPDDVKKVYYVEVESKEKCFFTFLVSTSILAQTYNERSSKRISSYDWEC